MNRRSNDMNGWVNFPVNDPRWKNSKEGGMFVKLVVCDDREFDKKFGICCGVHVHDHLGEMLIADDRRPQPEEKFGLTDFSSEAEFVKAFDEEQAEKRKWEEYHFPLVHSETDRSYISRDYLAVVIMGSTGWSGYSDELDQWHCTYDDLTEDGKAMYSMLQKLYEGCTLHLLTFLDT